MSVRYYIPNTLESWKWPRRLNPYYLEVKEESAAWARGFGAFSPKAQHAYDRCELELLGALTFPSLDKDFAHEDEVQVMANVIMDALRNPHAPRPKANGLAARSPDNSLASSTQAIVQQAADRTRKYVRNIQEYWQELSKLAIEMAILDNDILSYNLEQARGDDNHNIITILMHHNKVDIQGAMDWVDTYHKELNAKFMDIYDNGIPKFGEPVDTELARYVE
ncbi:isoprenoid synthase domain-containing protein, partial [Russula brevipes]